MRTFSSIIGLIFFFHIQQSEGTGAPGALKDISFDDLSHKAISRIGEAALKIRKDEWKHAETENFVYHYFQSHIASAVSVEAEYYYKSISTELGKDTTQWERKCHIYIFEKLEDWALIQL